MTKHFWGDKKQTLKIKNNNNKTKQKFDFFSAKDAALGRSKNKQKTNQKK